eukprot:GHVQ01034514.1.p1 GENE.GHVQ01034514.1~~GHVQ01034514.1.p1  ORF type:complete len:103 (-),score=9.92 GHVQ01034514.1:422-730(-)
MCECACASVSVFVSICVSVCVCPRSPSPCYPPLSCLVLSESSNRFSPSSSSSSKPTCLCVGIIHTLYSSYFILFTSYSMSYSSRITHISYFFRIHTSNIVIE